MNILKRSSIGQRDCGQMGISNHYKNYHWKNIVFSSLLDGGMVPVEMGISSARRIGYDEEQNEKSMNTSLDLLEERRDDP